MPRCARPYYSTLVAVLRRTFSVGDVFLHRSALLLLGLKRVIGELSMQRAVAAFFCSMLVWVMSHPSGGTSPTIRPATKTLQLFPCFICEEQQRYEHDDDDETLEELIERDEQEGFLAVEEMDDQLVDISSNIWKKPQTNIHALTNDIEQLRDSIQNSSITLDAAEERLKTAKSRYDAVTLERETNERSALKHWIQLPTMRHRLLKFEQRLLTNDVYGSNRSQIVKIDKMRTTINDIAVQLRGVYEYYFISDEDLVNAGLMLSEAESEMQKRRALLPTEKPKQKCFWFICI
ncbi:hypothetical protein Tcan_05281 [Toxocara canis]|uniref:Uncharacterized protein n=1 Tax=Toxocara canis TaxID=6265 RepID=A0A0B2VHT2_TOXCA|nr:hypothetical protein Tcan_05281 [Toxocara canis]